jgi:hypothetical protein
MMNDLNLDPRLPHSQLSSTILGSCFDVMNELGIGFLESVYKNALFLALREKGLLVQTEKTFEVYFKRQQIDYKRLHHPIHYPAAGGDPAYPVTS